MSSLEKKRDIAPSEGGSAFASTTRPQSASALTGSEARDGSAALSQGGPDLSRALTSAGAEAVSRMAQATPVQAQGLGPSRPQAQTQGVASALGQPQPRSGERVPVQAPQSVPGARPQAAARYMAQRPSQPQRQAPAQQAAPSGPFASTNRPQSASALTGSEARDGSAALSSGTSDLGQALSSPVEALKGQMRETGSLGLTQPVLASSHEHPSNSRGNEGRPVTSGAGKTGDGPALALPAKDRVSSGSNRNMADQISGFLQKKQEAREARAGDAIATAITGEAGSGSTEPIKKAKGATDTIRSALGTSGLTKAARATTVAATLVSGGGVVGRGTSLMRPQGPMRPTKASTKELEEEVVKSAKLAAYGDYGFVGAAARIAEQTGVFAGSKARTAIDAIGSSKLGKLAVGLDKGIAQSVLDGGPGGVRPHDANMSDRMAKQASRSGGRAVRGGLKVALQGGSALDIARESAIGAADDEDIDGLRSAWQAGKNVKKIAKKGKELLKKRSDPSLKGPGEKIGKNPVSKLSESVKRRYAQGKSRAIKKALDAGKSMRGMTAGQRVDAIARAISNGFSRVVQSAGSLFARMAAALAPFLPWLLGLLLLMALVLLLFGGANEENKSKVENANLPAAVLQWDGDATRIGTELDMVQWKPLMLAMMAQESGGDPGVESAVGARGDIMQAAEGAWGWVIRNGAAPGPNWPYSAVEANTPQASLYAGYLELRDNLGLFGVKEPTDTQGVMDVVQGYNFGARSWHSWLTRRNTHYSYDEAYAFAANWVRLNGRISSIAPGYGNPNHANQVMRYYNTNVGGGQEYSASSDQQKAIVDAAMSVGSPGSGLCAKWVSQVYSRAGLGYPGGNANDMYWNYTWSSDPKDLKVGMIVAVPSHTHTDNGRTYGHVAIYVGDGKVMENVGDINTQSLDSWIKWYGTTYTPRWGFAGGVAAN